MKRFLSKALVAGLVLSTFLQASPGEAQAPRYSLEQIHAFAMAQLERIQPLSFQFDLEYCGFIAVNRQGLLVATSAKRGSLTGCRLGRKPRGLRVIASYHSHGAHNRRADSEVPSVADLKNDFRQRLNGYIGTPGGRVWFNDQQSRASILLCGPGCITSDPNYFDCPQTRPEASYTVRRLKWRKRTVNNPC